MGTLNEALMIEIKGDIKDIKDSLNKVKKESASTTKSITTSFLGVAKTLAKVGVAGTAAFAGFGVLAIKKAADAEKAFANLSGLFKKSTEELSGYKDAIDKLGLKYGVATTEMTDAFYQSVSAGFRTLTEASSVVEAATKAAVAGSTEIPTSVEAITRVLNAYNLTGDQATKVSDLLFQTVNYGVTTFAELAPQIGMVAGMAAKANVPMEEMFATLATLTKTMPTPEAVTSLTQMISGFIKPTEGAAAAAKQYGIDLSAAGLSAIGLVGAMQQISKLNVEQQAELFPNVRALRGVMAASANGAVELSNNLQQMSDIAGTTDRNFGKMENTFSYQWNNLTNAIGKTIEMIGEAFLPEMKMLLGWFEKTGKPMMIKWAQELKIGMEEWRKSFVEETAGMTTQQKLSKAWQDLMTWFSKDALPAIADAGVIIGGALASAIWEALKVFFTKMDLKALLLSFVFGKVEPGSKFVWPWEKQAGGYAQHFAGGGWVNGLKGPDMIPTQLTHGEAVISAGVASDPRNRPLVDNLIAQGQAGGTYHDVSTINITANERITKEMFQDDIIPMIQDAKRSGLLFGGVSW